MIPTIKPVIFNDASKNISNNNSNDNATNRNTLLQPQDPMIKAQALFQAMNDDTISKLPSDRKGSFITVAELNKVCNYIEKIKNQGLPLSNIRYDKKKTNLKISIIWESRSQKFYLKNIRKNFAGGHERQFSLWQSYDDCAVLAAGRTSFLPPNQARERNCSNEKTEQLLKQRSTEVTVLKKFVGNDHIVQYYDHIVDSPNIAKNRHFLLLKFYNGSDICQGQDLFYIIEHFLNNHKIVDFRQKLQFIYDILRSLATLENQAIHRDMKIENFFTHTSKKDKNIVRAVLGDFGYVLDSETLQKEILDHRSGTPKYLAPEILFYYNKGEESDEFHLNKLYKQFGHAADVWACACVIFIILYQHDVHWFSLLQPKKHPFKQKQCSRSDFQSCYLKVMKMVEEGPHPKQLSETVSVQKNLEHLVKELNLLLLQMFRINDESLDENSNSSPPRITGNQALSSFKKILGSDLLQTLEE